MTHMTRVTHLEVKNKRSTVKVTSPLNAVTVILLYLPLSMVRRRPGERAVSCGGHRRKKAAASTSALVTPSYIVVRRLVTGPSSSLLRASGTVCHPASLRQRHYGHLRLECKHGDACMCHWSSALSTSCACGLGPPQYAPAPRVVVPDGSWFIPHSSGTLIEADKPRGRLLHKRWIKCTMEK